MLLNILYSMLLIAVSPLLIYRACRYGKYRHGWPAKLWGATGLPPSDRRRLWLHAVSVGEINLLRGLVQKIEARHPDLPIVVSSTTATGFELAKQHFGKDRVFYCPLDFTWAVRRTIREVNPSKLVLAELEIWPNLIAIATSPPNPIPVVVINGRLSRKSFRGYRRFLQWVQPTFRRLTMVACQDDAYAERFRELGTAPESVFVTGSIKFDDAPTDRETAAAKRCIEMAGLKTSHQVWVAGSLQGGEEAIILRAFKRLQANLPELRLLIVPRHPENFDNTERAIQNAGLQCRRRSQTQPNAEELKSEQVFLVDSIGELKDWWATADIAFVGGSFGNRGGQNMLEPAGYGAAVCFGPNTKNFRDIVSHLLSGKGAEVVQDEDALVDFIQRMATDPETATRMGNAAKKVVQQHLGATEKTLRLLNLDKRSAQAPRL